MVNYQLCVVAQSVRLRPYNAITLLHQCHKFFSSLLITEGTDTSILPRSICIAIYLMQLPNVIKLAGLISEAGPIE